MKATVEYGNEKKKQSNPKFANNVYIPNKSLVSNVALGS